MVTTYPAQIDTIISLPPAVDNLTPVRAKTVNDLRTAIINIEISLGVSPAGPYGSVANRLLSLENNFNNLVIIELTGDLGGSTDFPLVVGLQGRPVSSAAPGLAQVLTWNGIAWVPATPSGGGAPSGPAGGDLSGTYPNPIVAGLHGNSVPAPSGSGTVLTWNGSSLNWSSTGGGVPSGPAGGDLTGTYPNPVVAKLQGHIVSSSSPGAAQDGYVLTWVNSNIDYELKPVNSGTITLVGAVTGTNNVNLINLTSNTSITGVLPTTNQAVQTMVGDVIGTTAASTVVALRSKALDSSLSSLGSSQDGYVLTWINASSDWQAKKASSSGGSGILYSNFFALMPGDNSATIAVGAPVLFPQNGPSNGAATSLGGGLFNLPAIGTYEITWQVSVTEAGQLQLAIGGVGLPNTVVGRAMTTDQIVGSTIITTIAINSQLSIINPVGNAAALTITPSAGGTNAVSATINIKLLTS